MHWSAIALDSGVLMQNACFCPSSISACTLACQNILVKASLQTILSIAFDIERTAWGICHSIIPSEQCHLRLLDCRLPKEWHATSMMLVSYANI